MHTTSASLSHTYTSPSQYVSFVFFQVEETFTFQEGQFVMIHATIDRKEVKRPYSIATTNTMLQEEKTIGIVVKKTSDNGMSDWLTHKIQKGDTVGITGPVGHYTDTKKYSKYLFVSVGSGLSPNLGLFTHLAYETQQDVSIINIFGERYYKHIVPHIEDIFLNHGKTDITNIFHLSQEEDIPEKYADIYKKGHVQDSLTQAIETLGIHTSCFLCGKPEMVDDVRQKLEALGVAKEDITFEKY